MPLANLLRHIRRRAWSPAQLTAHAYWQACSDTFIANPDYYRKVEAVLRESILPLIPAGGSVLDAGCGNGRYTCMVATRARAVEAFDLSPSLVHQARCAAAEQALRHVRFEVGDVADVGRRSGTFDLVACTGVLSTIVDDGLVLRIMAGLRRRTADNGLLLLRDSLSRLPEGQLVTAANYATKYHFDGWYHRVSTLR